MAGAHDWRHSRAPAAACPRSEPLPVAARARVRCGPAAASEGGQVSHPGRAAQEEPVRQAQAEECLGGPCLSAAQACRMAPGQEGHPQLDAQLQLWHGEADSCPSIDPRSARWQGPHVKALIMLC